MVDEVKMLFFGIKDAESYITKTKRKNPNELLGESKFGSWVEIASRPIYFRKHGSQNRTLLEGSQNWTQEYRSSLVIPVDVLAEP
jgi:hypothetical protein